MAFKFAVLSAVSSDMQATEDKDSLDHQLRTALAYGERTGGVFIREFRADGYSRTGYWDLSQAFLDAPPLGELAAAALRHEFDVIILESFDRLGDLGYMLWSYLKWVGSPYIQLRSVQQALPITDPAIYNPAQDDITPTIINNSLNTNVYRVHKIIRGFAVGIAKRARDGKFAMVVPHGYDKIDKDTCQVNPRVAGLLVKFPEWFLSGVSLGEIARRANESGILSKSGKPWVVNVITTTLRNPFYSGKTFYGRGYRDKKLNYRYNDRFELYDGRHEPLWSYETHLRILAEFKRRRSLLTKPNDYNLTGLIRCSVCGNKLRVGYNSRNKSLRYWQCKGHVWIRIERANELVAAELRRLFDSDTQIPTEAPQTPDYTERELNALRRQMTRLEQAYESGAYTPDEFAEKRKAFKAREAELTDAEHQQAEMERRQEERREVYETMRDLRDVFGEWLVGDEPRAVKFHLSRVVRLTAYPDKSIRAELA